MKYLTLGLSLFALSANASEPGTIELPSESIRSTSYFNANQYVQSGDATITVLAVFGSSAAEYAHSKMAKSSRQLSSKSFIEERVNEPAALPFSRINLSGGGTIKIKFVDALVLKEDFATESHASLHDKIKKSKDWLEELDSLRKEHKADLVAFFKGKKSGDNAKGKAAYLRSTTDSIHYKTYGFFSVSVEIAYKEAYYLTTAHEIGHILGAGHNVPVMIDTTDRTLKRKEHTYPYNQGYGIAYNLSEYGEVKPYAASVMAYTSTNKKNLCDIEQLLNDHEYDKTGDWGQLPLSRFKKSCRRIPYFTDGGVTLGRSVTYPTNNSLAIADSARSVAGYY